MDKYELISFIGKGHYGTISKIKRKADNKILVWKELNYGKMNEKGQYRLTELKAVKEKKQLKVTLRKKEGMMPETDRKIRIGYVYGGRVQYSIWKTGDEITISI